MTAASASSSSSAAAASTAARSRAPPATCATWLGVAFWKKPLHLIVNEATLPGHGGGSNTRHRESPSAEGDDAGAAAAPQEIERTLELFDLIMIGIGGTVGAGVFATAGLIAAAYAGPAAILSWLIAGIGCILSGLSFMELSCLIPSAGSTYAYAYHALGELPAMFAGFLLTLEYGVSSAGGARSWSDKFTNWLETEFGVAGPEWMKPKDSTMDLYAGLLMTANVLIVLGGMQAGKTLINVVTMTKISVVLFIIVFGFFHFDAANITPFIPPSETTSVGTIVFGWPGIFLGASASFFGYIGYDEVCCLAGEAKNPTRNIPRAVIGTIVGAAVLSTLATFSLVGMQRYSDIDAGESYGKAFEHVGWPWAATIVTTGEVFTMPITSFIGFMAQPRVQYAMAKDGLLPAVFARLDHNGNLFHGTLLCGIAVVVIATFVPFKVLWNFISLGILAAFNLTNASLLLVRGSRLRDDQSVGGHERSRTFTHVLLCFLVTSFLAAFHWQKSVIAPVVLTSGDEAKASYWHQYLQSWGPNVAAICSVFAVASMCGLKYIEASAPPPLSSTKTLAETKRTIDGDSENELPIPAFSGNDGALGHSELELGQLRRVTSREKHLHETTDDDETFASESDVTPSLHSRQSDESSDEDADISHRSTRSVVLLVGGTETNDDDDDDNGKPSTFQAPLVPFSPCVAIFFNWFLFAQMDASSVALVALWLLLALAVYVSYSVHHSLARQQLQYHRLCQ